MVKIWEQTNQLRLRYVLLSFYLFFFLSLESNAQSYTLITEMPTEAVQFSTDKLQNLYLISPKNEVIKYDKTGKKQFLYNNNRLGELAYIDANNPFKLLLFYPEFGNIIVDVGRAEAILRRNQQIRGEMFQVGDRIKAYVQDVRPEPKGPQIFLSRTDDEFLRKLFEMEVPEIYDNIIEIKSIAREPGSKAKVAEEILSVIEARLIVA